ncbi:MAG TPA: phosphotransferase [Bacilli bacterium]|nr:phosphotransferase [Bacilli bacterium]
MNRRSSILRLAAKFRLQGEQVDTIKAGVYRVTSAKGAYCLKRMRYSAARIRWIDTTLHALQQQGFSHIAWRDREEETGRTLMAKSKQNIPFILTPWLSGRQPSVNSRDDLIACARRLAEFHRAGQGIELSDTGGQNLIGKWPKLLQKKRDSLAKAVRKASHLTAGSTTGSSPASNSLAQVQSGHPRLDKTDANRWAHLLRQHGSDLLDRADSALTELENSSYRTLCRQAARQGVLCHGDSGPKNFVITAQGPALIDFETLRIDLPIYDLFRMVRLACKGKGWSFDTARHILDGYNQVTELKPIDYQLLRVWLLFPHKACKLLAKCDFHKPSERTRFAHDLERAIRDERHLQEFLNDYDEYVNGR